MLEHLVYEQHLAAQLMEIARKLGNAVTLEIEVVHVYVQA